MTVYFLLFRHQVFHGGGIAGIGNHEYVHNTPTDYRYNCFPVYLYQIKLLSLLEKAYSVWNLVYGFAPLSLPPLDLWSRPIFPNFREVIISLRFSFLLMLYHVVLHATVFRDMPFPENVTYLVYRFSNSSTRVCEFNLIPLRRLATCCSIQKPTYNACYTAYLEVLS